MSYDANGVFQGHTSEDDVFEHTLSVGCRVRGSTWGDGSVYERNYAYDGTVIWAVRWDDPGADDEYVYPQQVHVIA